MTLDKPWKIAAIIAALVALRIVWRLWRRAPARKGMVELLDSGIIAFVLVFFIIRPFVIQAFYIPSRSMEGTLLVNDRILVSKFIYRFHPPERGDIVVFKSPLAANAHGLACDACGERFTPPGMDTWNETDAPSITVTCPHCGAKILLQKDFIKRLVARGGDRVRIHDGVVYVNDAPLDEPYIKERPVYEFPTASDAQRFEVVDGDVIVPPNHYFVLGDNRNDSNDSHAWGFVPAENVLGKALVVFWSHPPNEGVAWDRLGWKLLIAHPGPKRDLIHRAAAAGF